MEYILVDSIDEFPDLGSKNIIRSKSKKNIAKALFAMYKFFKSQYDICTNEDIMGILPDMMYSSISINYGGKTGLAFVYKGPDCYNPESYGYPHHFYILKKISGKPINRVSVEEKEAIDSYFLDMIRDDRKAK
jgi:hypothetical protein